MALNAASHNPTGEKTGPVSGHPPSLSSETTSALLGASQDDPVGQQGSGLEQAGDEAVEAGDEGSKERERGHAS
ncbi:valine--tRNA ligase [Mycoblastus sanguinarius]|nr:valine--tRNA ligase [Mycoblastus sanguinarius]